MPSETHTSAPWRYEESTKTIRSVPANYWLASMDSWDGAVNHTANARLIAAAPDLLAALINLRAQLRETIKLDVKKHYSLMVADAAAGTAIDKAEAK